jgi:hypothetical protein
VPYAPVNILLESDDFQWTLELCPLASVQAGHLVCVFATPDPCPPVMRDFMSWKAMGEYLVKIPNKPARYAITFADLDLITKEEILYSPRIVAFRDREDEVKLSARRFVAYPPTRLVLEKDSLVNGDLTLRRIRDMVAWMEFSPLDKEVI